MPQVVFDTGFLMSLAVDRDYSDAVRSNWAGRTFWVPASVAAELRIRNAHPRADIPRELPRRALGIIASSAWNMTEVAPTDPENEEIRNLQERIGGPGNTENAGECEAAVLIARRDPSSLLAFDDPASLPVLAHYVVTETGQELKYVHTTTVITELVRGGHIDGNQQAAILKRLRQKGRPLI